MSVEIIPNRRQVDNKFPVLGFTVKTDGLPFYEVILTTRRELFAAQNSAQRSAGNYYSSRQEKNQLEKTNPNDSVYFVPPTVLNAFAQTKPNDIFYALIAYRDEQGSGGVCSSNIDRLHFEAPSVSVSQSFTGQTLSKVLGIFTDSAQDYTNYSQQTSYQSYENGDYFESSFGETDEDSAEDGYSMMKSLADSFANNEESAAEDGYEFYQRENATAQATDVADDWEFGSQQKFSFNDYEDGYESEDGEIAQSYSRIQESVFPADASEPETLYQDDGEFYGDESRSQSFSAQPEFEYAGISSNGHQYGHNGKSAGYQDDYGFQSSFDDYDDGFGENYSEPFEDKGKSSLENIPLVGRMIKTATDAIKGGISAAAKIIAKKRIIDIVAKAESGGNPFKAINADTEFAKLKTHEAYGKWHIGLSYGIVQFTQDGGALGKLLVLMRERDKAKFDEIFGNNDPKIADELIRVTNASGDFSEEVYNANPKGDGRSNRVQPVNGADLWVSPWKERFELAGDHPPFQGAQNQLAATAYFDPMIQFCEWLELNTDRAYGMCYDRSVQMGDASARKWIIGVVGPISTDALRQEALKALGQPSLEDFQHFMKMKKDGWGPKTHAAMVSELRKLGAKSPIPIPTREQMMDSMVRAAAGKSWEKRVKHLRNTTEFSDTVQSF